MIRVTLQMATIFDHITTTSTTNIIKMVVHVISLSDHYMVYCIIKHNGAIERDHKKIKTMSMKHFSENQFLSHISGISSGQFLNQTDEIDMLVNNWSSLVSFVIDKTHL